METSSNDKAFLTRFITKHAEFSIPDTSYSIPATTDVDSLNVFVKELLKDATQSVDKLEFDFIVDSRILRSSLDVHLLSSTLSTEHIIEIEYVIKQKSPEPADCLLHDDWVSAVELKNTWILTGCYDNSVNLWNKKGTHMLAIPGHTGAVKAVTWCHLDQTNGVFVSGSMDQTAMLWHWKINENAVQCVGILRGHERGIESISCKNSILATGGWDSFVKLWSVKVDDVDMPETIKISYPTEESADSASQRKRTKFDDNTKTRTPLITMKGHRECVNGIKWMSDSEIATASWDHTIRIWDAHLGGIKKEFIGNKAFFDLDYHPENDLLLTSSADRHVRIYDARSDSGAVCKSTYTSHTQWVQSVRWNANNCNLFMSGGQDFCVKIWDMRSTTTPLYDLTGHEDSVLCTDWNHGQIVSGGADNTLRVFKDKNKN